MIYIIYGRVVTGKTGKKYMVQHRKIMRFDNNEDFGFDIFVPKNWQKFLDNYKFSSGKSLPRFSRDGDPIAYYVYAMGLEQWMKDYLGKGSRSDGSYHILFPGVDKEKSKVLKRNKSLEIAKFGRLSN